MGGDLLQLSDHNSPEPCPTLHARLVCFLCLCAISLAPAKSMGWGQEGHRLIAAVAESRLETGARHTVAEMIGEGGLPSVANWADEIRKDRPETAPWHYVDLPREQPDYDPSRDCAHPKEGDCVIAAIERFRSVLADRHQPRRDRAEALKFLIHLVGDIHQPLHCLKDDDGGTALEVVFFGEAINPFNGKPWNLHAVWDAGLITQSGLDEEAHVRTLLAWIDAQPDVDLQKGTAREWALESKEAAIRTAYRLPADLTLGASYLQASLPVLHSQLAKAGIRLAALLNEVFR